MFDVERGIHPHAPTRYGIPVSQMTTDRFHLRNTLPGPFFIHDLSPGLTRRVPLVEQELLTLPEHMGSPPVFSAGLC
jgi:hypothetical protein